MFRVTEQQVLGGNLGFHALLPLNDIRLNIKNGPHEHKRGLGDAHLGPVIGFHHSDKFHTAMGVDFVVPTGGEYDKNDLVNLGTNYYTVQAVYAMTYMDPTGFNADVRLMYDYNFENQDTHYQSGRELHADYTLGWGLGNGWVLGIGGHAYKQVSDDQCAPLIAPPQPLSRPLTATAAVPFPSARPFNTPARMAGFSAPNGKMNPASATVPMARPTG